MKKYILNKILIGGLFAISSLVIEAFLFLFLGFGFLPTYILFDVSLIMFVLFILLFLPAGRSQNIVVGVLLFLQIVLSYMNICIYTALGDVFSFEMLSLVDETARVVTTDMFPVWPLIFYVCFYAIVIFLLILIRKKIKPQNITYRSVVSFIMKDIVIVGLTLSLVLYSCSYFLLNGREDDDLYIFSDKVLYSNFSSSKQALVKFGTWGFYFEEFFRRFYKVDSVMSYSKQELIAYKNSSEYDPKKQKLYNVAHGQNVLVMMLESFEWYGITPELTPTLYALANGYDFGTRNKETGLYSNFDYYTFDTKENGKTSILRNDYTFDGEKYEKIEGENPLNLDNFGEYGLTLTNYYSKSKTDYSEASVILGNYPYNQSFTTHGGVLGYSSKNLYSDIDYNFTLPNLLESSGAVEVTNYLHTYLSTFYGRDTLIPQFGFDKQLFLDQMSSKIEVGDSLAHAVRDSDVVDYYLKNVDEYNFLPKDKQFFSFYTTVATHGQYDYNPLLTDHYKFLSAVDYIGKTENGINDYGLSEELVEMVRNYHASILDTEYTVTLIIKHLMENDLFDKTMLVLFSDHQCYYDGMDVNYKKLYFTDNETKGVSSPMYWERGNKYGEEYGEKSQDRYLVPAMIYSTKIDDSIVGAGVNSHFVDKFTCAFDLPVTIFNLLGVDYNTSYYLGYPVFCEDINEKTGEVKELGIPAYVSCTGGIFNEYIYTEDGVDVKFYKSKVKLQNEFQIFSYRVSEYIERWYKITYLYEYDLF